MPYFDAADEEHLNLLPKEHRVTNKVTELAPAAEADVIAAFTLISDSEEGVLVSEVQHPSGSGTVEHRVFLLGYAVDPDEADATLAFALRQTIADVISWRIRTSGWDPSLKSDKGKQYRDSTDAPFPRNWAFRLSRFRTSVGTYVI